jgi:roadblock/LC7 domain-containing protein
MSEQQTPSYDPNKKYTWTPDDSFILSGGEFGLVLNALRAVLNTQEAARILIANEANKIVESALQRAVENGIAKEAEDSE